MQCINDTGFGLVSSRAPVRGHHLLPREECRNLGFKSCPREGASNPIGLAIGAALFQVVPP